MSDEKSCGTCRHIDEYFGDCCHPDGKGCLDPRPAIIHCLENGHAWWKPKRTREELLQSMQEQEDALNENK